MKYLRVFRLVKNITYNASELRPSSNVQLLMYQT